MQLKAYDAESEDDNSLTITSFNITTSKLINLFHETGINCTE